MLNYSVQFISSDDSLVWEQILKSFIVWFEFQTFLDVITLNKSKTIASNVYFNLTALHSFTLI